MTYILETPYNYPEGYLHKIDKDMNVSCVGIRVSKVNNSEKLAIRENDSWHDFGSQKAWNRLLELCIESPKRYRKIKIEIHNYIN